MYKLTPRIYSMFYLRFRAYKLMPRVCGMFYLRFKTRHVLPKYSVAGRQGDCYILPILEGLASIARDCKRDIYSRFLHINLYINTFTHTYISIQFILVHQLSLYITCILLIDYFYI